MNKITLMLLFFLSFNCIAEQSNQKLEEEKINFLLSTIKESKVVFLRNGDEHSGKKASKHLQNKMNYARRAFWLFGPKTDLTVDNFINKIASRSSTTKKEYHVRLEDGSMITTGTWLKAKLKEFNKTHSPPSKK